MSKPPLWEVMHQADQNVKLSAEQDHWPRYIKAAEIRAVRDWLVPEEPSPSDVEFWPDAESERDWQYNQRLRALLTAEADRAERGEVEHD